MTSTYPDIKYAWASMPTGSSGSPVTISYTVSYSIGADSQNKDQGWALLSYLTGPEGMTTGPQGGVALPSRTDVPAPEGKDVLVSEAAYAEAGSGFMPGYNDVQKAFQDEFTNQIQKKTFDAGPVVHGDGGGHHQGTRASNPTRAGATAGRTRMAPPFDRARDRAWPAATGATHPSHHERRTGRASRRKRSPATCSSRSR